jgi:hypothetical protein
VTCDGEGVFGLKADDLVVKENGDVISATESQALLIEGVNLRKEVFVTLLLDNSPSVAANGALNDAVDAAQTFATKLFDNDSENTYISVAFFSKTFEVRQAFTNDASKVLEAIASLKDDTTGSNTTNLYGAMIDALDASKYVQSERSKNASGGLLTVGELVVFTDGKDQAGLYSLSDIQSTLSNTNDGATVISFGGDMAPEILESIGKSGSYIANEPADLLGVFEKVADLLNSESIARYVLAYCSPKLGGTHTVSLEVSGKEGQLAVPFDASDFNGDGPECSISAIESACDDVACGGLWCGGCGKHGACLNETTCLCMDNAIGDNCDACAPGWTGTDCTVCTLGDDCPMLFTSIHASDVNFGRFCGITIEGEVACFNARPDPGGDLYPYNIRFEYNLAVRDFGGPQTNWNEQDELELGIWALMEDGSLRCPTEDCPDGSFRSIDALPFEYFAGVRTDGSLLTWRSDVNNGEWTSTPGSYANAYWEGVMCVQATDGTVTGLAYYNATPPLEPLTTSNHYCMSGKFVEYFSAQKAGYIMGIRDTGILEFRPWDGGFGAPITYYTEQVVPPAGKRFRNAASIKDLGAMGCGILDDFRLHCWNKGFGSTSSPNYNAWFDHQDINENEKRTFRQVLGAGNRYAYGLTTEGQVVRLACSELNAKDVCDVEFNPLVRGQFTPMPLPVK